MDKNNSNDNSVASNSSDTGVSAAKKPNNKLLKIVIVVVAVLVVLGGSSALAYNMWYQDPDKVVTDGIANFLDKESLSGKGTLSYKSKDADTTIAFSNKAKDGQLDLQTKISANLKKQGVKFDVSGNAIYDKDGNLYIKVDNTSSLLDTIMKLVMNSSDMQGSGSDNSASDMQMNNYMMAMMGSIFKPVLDKIDGNWIKITPSDLQDKDKSSGDTLACLDKSVDLFFKDDKAREEIVDTYRDNSFLAAKKELGSKDGDLGYLVEYDKNTSNEFGKSLESTKIGKELASCVDKDSKDNDKVNDAKDKASDLSNVKAKIWISRWSHELSKIELTATSDKDNTDVKFTYTFDNDTDIKISAPKDYITVDELSKSLNGILGGTGNSSDGVLEDSNN